jgi:hypothetical protein
MQHVLVCVEVCGRVEMFDGVGIIDEQGVSAAGAQSYEVQRGFEPLDFLQ